MSIVFLPVLIAGVGVLQPAFDLATWQALLVEPQLPLALRHTFFSAIGSTLLAVVLALSTVILLYPSHWWQWLVKRLAVLLAFPHLAFAVGFGFLIAPSGFIARMLAPLFSWSSPPSWQLPQDSYALSLMVGLALKESWFLLWVLTSLLQQHSTLRALHVAQSLGYGRLQIWLQVLLPQVLPRLAWPLMAVLAYSVSVVDMALVLAPTTPPPLAVLGWQWFNDLDPKRFALGSAVSVLLLLIILGLSTLGYGLFKLYPLFNRYLSGKRWRSGLLSSSTLQKAIAINVVLIGWLALILLSIWSFANQWFYPSLLPSTWTLKGWWQLEGTLLTNTLVLGLSSSLVAVIVVISWLEAFAKNRVELWYFPLVLPAVPLVVAQYEVVIRLHSESTYLALVWAHLLWVVPYVLLVLASTYQNFDQRLMLTAQALGHSDARILFQVKLPLLWRPISAAFAVGFAVSVAQYLPTVMIGAGQISTLTTEAVVLSTGGNRRTLAVYALGQALLPWLMFLLMMGLTYWQSYKRSGLR
ncbi:MAG: hypothetical protein RLZZ422_1982 [Pseudomonadota bacterium]|jgi:putative thiamine transport system permease protein